jgi:mRNA interferase MazF
LGKIQPVLVVGIPFLENERTLRIIVPHTTSLIGTRFEVAVNHPMLEAKGVFDVQQIAAVPAIKFVRRLGHLNSEQMHRVETVMAQALGLKLAVEAP